MSATMLSAIDPFATEPTTTEPEAAAQREMQARLKRLDSRAAVLLGWTARDPAEALTHFHRALQLDAENESALQGLSWALRRSAQAAPTLSEAVDEVGVAEAGQPVEDSAPGAAPALVETGTALIYAEDFDDDVDAEPTATPVTRPSRIGTGPLPPIVGAPPASSAAAPPPAEAPPRRARWRWSAHASDIRNPNFWIPTGYLLAITLAEALTVTLFPQGGLILHGLLFVALLVHTALMPRAPQQRAMLAVAFAPLIRLLSLSMPLANVPQLYWYFIVGAPLFAAAFLTARAMRYPPAKIGLALGHLPTQLTIGLSGIFLGYVEYAILQPEPLIIGAGWEAFALAALILFVFTGLLEEVVFRGVMQRAMSEGVGRYGLVYVAVLFAVLHLGYHSALDFLFVLAVALYFGVVVARTGSILGVTLAHGLTNTTMFLFFPFVRPAFDSPAPEALISAVVVAVSAGLALLLGPLLLRRPARAISR